MGAMLRWYRRPAPRPPLALLLAFVFALALPTVLATNHILRMDEVGAGMDGDTNVQYVVITTVDNSQKDWGPQFNEPESRAMLVFFDGSGAQTAVFKFPNDPPNGRGTVLIATAAFTNRTGLRADFVIPALIHPGSGKVCFRGNPANPNRFTVNLCLSYGSFPPGLTEGAGPPAPALPVSGDPTALVRFQNFIFGENSSRNADFRLDTPHPTNTAGQTISFAVPGPEVSVFPPAIDLGGQATGGRRSALRTLTIQNQGSIHPLHLTNLTLLTLSNEFRIVADSGETMLAAGRTRTVQLDFAPLATGLRRGSIEITCNDSSESVIEIPLLGRGVDLTPCAAPDPAAAAAMDNCADAMLITSGLSYFGNTEGATNDGTNACSVGAVFDVWYRYVAASNGLLQATLDRTSADIRSFSAHTSCPGMGPNQLACATLNTQGEGSSAGPTAILNLAVTNHQELLFRIASRTNTATTYRLTLRGPAALSFDQDNNGIDDRCELDWGDAPDSYATSSAEDGPRHKRSALFLGQRWDHDSNGQPEPTASGDNLDGPPNDDDGVTFTTMLVPGQPAAMAVAASSGGFLNGWLDFSADGGWSQGGDQILSNHFVLRGTSVLTVSIPAGAVATNRTFARFRISSLPLVAGFRGLAEDGEVEDYAVEISPASPAPAGFGVRISEVMAGLNGDSAAQFVELEAEESARQWGPGPGESAGRAMLLFFDAAGRQTGRFVFPANAPAGSRILVATRAFARATGLEPDFFMPAEVMAIAGKVAFRANPDNPHFEANSALSYGGNVYHGPTDGAGPANTNQLPILGAASLTRRGPVALGWNRNDAFDLRAPSPENSAGQSVTPAALPLVKQGEILFSRETFNGNGRTCQTCHHPGRDQFALTPATVASLPSDDPLFVFEHNINLLQLVQRSQPSDLRGPVTGVTGRGTILAGSGDTYLVIGGRALGGTIADTNGNSGELAAFTAGDLQGPTPGNGSARGLEDHHLLRHGRGLVLENIDGFRRREVFRASPHLLNVAFTAPYGLSGDFSNLRDFSGNAVAQHFTRRLTRVSGTDFRQPTSEELAALEAFLNTLVHPRDGNFDLDRFATTEAQRRGRTLFFNNESKCFRCHSGPMLNEVSPKGSIASATGDNMDTGVANLITNLLGHLALPTEPPGFPPGQSARKFNVPSLFGVRLTAPFFHEGSARTLRETVDFYDGPEFISSPAGIDVGSMPAANDPAKIDDLVAFLDSLVELPIEFPRVADFGVACVGAPLGPVLITLTNTSTNVVHVGLPVIRGSNAANFLVLADTGTTNLPPGSSRTLEVSFVSATQGLRQATLEFEGDDPVLGRFSFGVALQGAIQDNIVAATPNAIQFGTLGIDFQANERRTVTITNQGSSDLLVQRMLFLGADATNFSFSRTISRIVSGAAATFDVIYSPRSRGTKATTLRIESLACEGRVVEIPISGVATSDVHHFTFTTIPSPQAVRADFPVTIEAHDRNNELIENFSGTAEISAVGDASGPPAVLVTEVDAGSTDRIEISNLSGQSVNMAGWRVVLFDPLPVVAATVIISSGTLAPRASFTVNEGGVNPGVLPSLFANINLGWMNRSPGIGVMVLNPSGQVVDFFTTGDASTVTNPVALGGRDWRGPGVAAVVDDGAFSFQRIGATDHNTESDWVMAPPNIGQPNPGLIVPASGPYGSISVAPGVVRLVQGRWAGELAVLEEGLSVILSAHDGLGRSGSSAPFDVAGTPPSLSGLRDLTMAEDSVAAITFRLEDVETAADQLKIAAVSSNPDLFSSTNLVLTGTEQDRWLRLIPRTNAFGSAIVTVTVSDGALTASVPLNVVVTPVNDPPVLLSSRNLLVENFDTTAQGFLPGGWSQTVLGGLANGWRVTLGASDTPPGSMFISNVANISDNALLAPTLFLTSSLTQISFRHSFNTHACCDGGWLEISINNSNFVNVLNAGATFAAGEYNAGTQWRGDSGGFITTIVNLPAAVVNRSVRLRWRFATDSSIGGAGWFIDTLSVRELTGSAPFFPVTLAEDTLSPPLIIQLDDAETPPHELQLAVQSFNAALLAETNVTITGTGSVRTISFRPATNAFGSGGLAFSLSDGNLAVTQSLSVTVTPVNDAPVFSPLSNRVAYVGETVSVPVSAVEVDSPTNSFVVTLLSGPAGALFNATNGVLTWIPAETQRGTNTIVFRALDSGTPAGVSTQSFRVVVTSPPLAVTNQLSFGIVCSTQNSVMPLVLTNLGSNSLAISLAVSGSNAAEFVLLDGGEEPQVVLAPAQAQAFPLAFQPQSPGQKQASLALLAREGDRGFLRTVALSGIAVDNVAVVTPSDIDFGQASIGTTSPVPQSITLSNSGLTPLVISSATLTGSNASDFRLLSIGPTNLPALGTHELRLGFAPARRGDKHAALRIALQACNATNIVVPLRGLGTSTLTHFIWDTIPSPQQAGVPFPARITAHDAAGDPVTQIDGPLAIRTPANFVRLLAFTRFADGNLLTRMLDAMDAHFADFVATTTTTTNTVELENALLDKHVFLIPEQQFAGSLLLGLGLRWASVLNNFVARGGTVVVCSHTENEEVLLRESGLLNPTQTGLGSQETLQTAGPHPLLEGVTSSFFSPAVAFFAASNTTALVTAGGRGVVLLREAGPGRVLLFGTDFTTTNTPLDRLLANAVQQASAVFGPAPVAFSAAGSVEAGVWTGTIVVSNELSGVSFLAADEMGHSGISGIFDIRGSPPVLSGVGDLVTDEDHPVEFTVGLADEETPVTRLLLSAHSSNPLLVPNTNILISGTGAVRTLRLVPLPDSFGAATITLTVRDHAVATNYPFLLRVRPVNDPPTVLASTILFSESFDTVTPPDLPEGWTNVSLVGSARWNSRPNLFSSAPNAVTLTNVAAASDTVLLSPPLTVPTNFVRLSFGHSFSLVSATASLELSTNGLFFTNVTALGSTFVTGGYNQGSQWGGSSTGLMRSELLLPPLPQPAIRFRWRSTNAQPSGVLGWSVDDVLLHALTAASHLGTLPMNEDTLSVPLLMVMDDRETGGSDLAVHITSSAPQLVPPSNVLLTGAGTSRTLQIRPSTNQFGTATIRLNVSDGLTTVSRTLEVNVRAVDDPPIIGAIGHRSIFVGERLQIQMVASDPDGPNDRFLFSLALSPSGATINPTNGFCTWQPSSNHVGTHDFRVLVQPDQASSGVISTQSFQVSVASPPLAWPTTLNFGTVCFPTNRGVTFFNSSAEPVIMDELHLVGTNAAEFVVQPPDHPFFIPAGSGAVLPIELLATQLGQKNATLHFVALVAGRRVAGSVELRATLIDNHVRASVAQVDFGSAAIMTNALAPTSVFITNVGTLPLQVISFGTTSAEFIASMAPTNTTLLPFESRRFDIAFRPFTRGVKTATMRFQSVACEGELIEIPLSGMATSSVTHFTFAGILTPRAAGTPFPVEVTARDVNGATVTEFAGPLQLTSRHLQRSETAPSILSYIAFADVTATGEYQRTLQALRRDMPDLAETTSVATTAATLEAELLGKDVFLVVEQELESGQMGNLGNTWREVLSRFVTNGGTVVVCSHNANEHQLLANSGLLSLSKATSSGVSALVTSPGQHHPFLDETVLPSEPLPVARFNIFNGSPLLRVFPAGEVVAAVRELGLGRVVIFGTDFSLPSASVERVLANIVRAAPAQSRPLASTGAISNGIWRGSATVDAESKALRLLASDDAGHFGISQPIEVTGSPPQVSAPPAQVLEEDGSATLTVNASDADASTNRLSVSVVGTNVALFPAGGVSIGGAGGVRTIHLRPQTNQFGSDMLAVTVSDGVLSTTRLIAIQVQPVNDPPSLSFGGVLLSENFDSVVPPSLPAGWAQTNVGATNPWRTTAINIDTPPNSIQITNPPFATDSSLISPRIQVHTSAALLSFLHNFNTEACCDGGLLEISINDGPFTNIISAGGSFLTGGYNAGLSWRGFSSGTIGTICSLPAMAAGQSVRLRWRFFTDGSGSAPGWLIDSVHLSDATSTNTPTLVTDEDLLSPPLALHIVAPDSLGPVRVSARSASPDLVADADIFLSGSGTARFLQVRPRPDRWGGGNITLLLEDGVHAVAHSIPVLVRPVNDPPVIAPIGNREIFLGELLSIPIMATDPDEPPQAITITLLSGPTGSTISNGVFFWRPLGTTGTFFANIEAREPGPSNNLSTAGCVITVVAAPLTTAAFDFGVVCVGHTNVLTRFMRNHGRLPFTAESLQAVGSNAADFALLDPPVPFVLGPGEQRGVTVAFTARSTTFNGARLQLTATVAPDRTYVTDSFLGGTPSDAALVVLPGTLDFGAVPLGSISAPQGIIVSNASLSPITDITISFEGEHAADFSMASDTGQVGLPARTTRRLHAAFAPRQGGVRSAALRVQSRACINSNAFVALNGTGLSQVTRFEFSSIGTTQFLGMPFAVSVSARDFNGDLVSTFNGPLTLALAGPAPRVLTFVRFADTEPSGEYQNTLAAIRGHYPGFTESSFHALEAASLESALVDKQVFLVVEQENASSELDAISAAWAPVLHSFVHRGGVLIVCSHFGNEHLFLVNSGLMDVTKLNTHNSGTLLRTGDHTLLQGVIGAIDANFLSTYRVDVGTPLLSLGPDTVVAVREAGAGRAVLIGSDFFARGSALDRVLANAVRSVSGSVATVGAQGSVQHGVWTGSVTVTNEARFLHLEARDDGGHSGLSVPFHVLGNPPAIAGVSNLVINEDTTGQLAVLITDSETSPAQLVMIVTPVDPGLVPQANVVVSGTGSNRTVLLTPATHAFGTTVVNIAVFDGAQSVTTNFLLRVRPVDDPPFVAQAAIAFREDFDAIPGPGLPAGWTTTVTSGSPWRVVNTQSDSPANAMFVGSVGAPLDTIVTTPAISTLLPAPYFSFRHRIAAAACCESGSLQVAIGSGAFALVGALGGVYISGTPNAGDTWNDTSGAFITTTVHFPSLPAGQTIRFRWRYVSSLTVGSPGWWIDTVTLTEAVHTNRFPLVQWMEDQPSPAVNFLIGDPDTPVHNLAVTGFSTNRGLLSSFVVDRFGPLLALTVFPVSNAFGSDLITLTVLDGASAASALFPVTILPTNDPPVITNLLDRSVHRGEQLAFFIRAVDPEQNAVAYQLQNGPSGSRLDSNTGWFTWSVPMAGASNYVFLVRAADDGVPPLSTSRAFQVTVAPSILAQARRDGPNLRLEWNVIPGRTYRVEYTDNLSTGQWVQLQGALVATNGLLEITTATSGLRRFYRITALPP